MIIAPDVSYFQSPLTDSFNRRVLIMRVTFGAEFVDPNFARNANQAAVLYSRGQIDGVILYTVYLAGQTPSSQYDAVWKAIGPTPPKWLLGIMIDVESWRGTSYSIGGDHSSALNTLAGMHAHRMGSWSAVLWYANLGDLNSIYPHRDSRLHGILANYTNRLTFKSVRGAIGQQYTDGETKWSVPVVNGQELPRSSVPFGHCDHNYLDFKNGKTLRQFMRPAKATKPPVAKPKPNPAPKPTVKPPAGPHYNTKRGNSLVSPDGAWAVFLQDDGTFERRHNGVHHDNLKGA